MKNPGSLITGKVVVITRASSGIGEATARMLASDGARLVVGARRAERLEALVSDLRAAGGTAEYQAVDVTQRDQVEALVDLARRTYGSVDVMINNAGIMPVSLLDQLKVDEWDQMIDVNIKGVLYGIAAALPIMREQNRGVSLTSLQPRVTMSSRRARFIQARSTRSVRSPTDCARKACLTSA